jgi:hypothetical protein
MPAQKFPWLTLKSKHDATRATAKPSDLKAVVALTVLIDGAGCFFAQIRRCQSGIEALWVASSQLSTSARA